MNSKRGEVVTFYSFKGGTGRTMALANTGVLMARKGLRVLMIDWDVDAPGLHKYFRDKIHLCDDAPVEVEQGLIELLLLIQKQVLSHKKNLTSDECRDMLSKIDSFDYILETTVNNLFLLPAGKQDGSYVHNVSNILWKDLFTRADDVFFHFVDILCDSFDYILVDSRTGYSDVSGICTMILPERLVLAFTPNHQNLEGVLDLARRSFRYRQNSDDLRPLIVYPLPSRIENAEKELRERWRYEESKSRTGYQPAFEKLLQEFNQTENIDLTSYFNDVQIQHESKYAYGEEIAAITEQPGDRLSLYESYNKFLAKLLIKEPIWTIEDTRPKVFISYSREDRDLFIAISNFLTLHKINVLNGEIDNASNKRRASVLSSNSPRLDKADWLIVLMSPDFHDIVVSTLTLDFLTLATRNKLVVQIGQRFELSDFLQGYSLIDGVNSSGVEISTKILGKINESGRFILDSLTVSSTEYPEAKLRFKQPAVPDIAPIFEDGRVKSIEASSALGTLLIHELKLDKYYVQLIEARSTEGFKISTKIDCPIVGMCVCLSESVKFSIASFETQELNKYQYFFFNESQLRWTFDMEKGQKCDFLVIYFNVDYLQHWVNTAGLAVSYYPAVFSISADMNRTIRDILNCEYIGKIKRMYLSAKILEALYLGLQQFFPHSDATELSKSDSEKIEFAREHLIQYSDSPITLKELSERIGMSERKLTMGFKKIYGTTIYGFILDARMERAREMLLNSEKTTLEIASEVGYKNIVNFTVAFKRRFGFTPSALKNTKGS